MTSSYRFVLVLSAVVCSLVAYSQSKARITITKDVNGKTTTETREIDLAEGQDINEILQDMGVLDDLGQLKSGQQFEINIDKSGIPDEERSARLFIQPGNPPTPPIAPMPPFTGLTGEQQNQAYLGVMLRDVEQGERPAEGAKVTEIIEDTPAEKAGLQIGDMITQIDGTVIRSAGDVVECIQAHEPGKEVKVAFVREGKKKNIKVRLGSRPVEMNSFLYGMPGEYPNQQEFLHDFDLNIQPDSITVYGPKGFKLPCDTFRICQPFSWNDDGFELKSTPFLGVTPGKEEGEPGVLIASVVEGSAAEEMGLVAGDIILYFNEVEVNSFDRLSEEISKSAPESDIEVIVLRNGREKTLRGTLGSRAMSSREDFRIFHDFKGMDEDGQFLYDFEFDMDEKDVENQMEDLLRLLEQQQQRIGDQRLKLEEDLNRLREDRTSLQIRIEITDITPEEAEQVNSSASPRLETRNDLIPDRISFFPNPGNGVLNLSFSLKDKGSLSVLIYDEEGSKIYTESRNDFTGEYTNTIDFSHHANGVYYLQILHNGKSFSRKLIKSE